MSNQPAYLLPAPNSKTSCHHGFHDQPETGAPQRARQPDQRFVAAEFGIDPGRVGDIVAVGGTGLGRQQRRRVQVTHAEGGVIVDLGGGVVELEAAMELQARGGARHIGGHGSVSVAVNSLDGFPGQPWP
jgi:hypothetical protein